MKFMDQSFCPKNCLDWYTKCTTTKNFKAIKPIYSSYATTKKSSQYFSTQKYYTQIYSTHTFPTHMY